MTQPGTTQLPETPTRLAAGLGVGATSSPGAYGGGSVEQ